MKAPAFCSVFALASVLSAGEVMIGDSLGQVRAVLGAPTGQLEASERHLLYYERGSVELRQGLVTRVDLRSATEQAQLEARAQKIYAERDAQRARLWAEGIALRDRKQTDAAFLASPVAYQVAFWENFSRSYPGVPCVEPLTLARLRLGEQLDQKRQQEEAADRLAEMEARLAATERRPEFYPIRTYLPYYGRRHHHNHQEFGLGQITYTFFDSPLPPYTTPSGNPAGNLTGPVINLPARNPALADWYGQDWSTRNDRKRDHRPDRSDWQGAERGRSRSRDRM
jgi:hypothetical protein